MGSMSLICPMCCGETFNNSESLKYHLLSMTDNLYCPGCSLRTYSVAALIQHLDACGKDLEQEELNSKNSQTDSKLEDKMGSDILMDDGDDPMSDSFLATVNEEGIMIVGEGRTIQVDENGDIQVLERGSHMQNESTSFVEDNDTDNANDNTTKSSKISAAVKHDHSMAKKPIIINESNASEFLNNNSDSLINMSPVDDIQMDNCNTLIKKESEMVPENDQEAEIMYSCSTCSLSFSSVLEHIQEYHNGQEVILEMAEQQLDEIEASTDAAVPTPVTSPLPPNKILQTPVQTKHRQSMNTLRTEECLDSEGRVYTRKVVQIERFSDRTPVTLSSTKAPMIEKFFSNVEGVKVRDKSVTVAPTRMYRCNQCLEQFAKLGDFRVHVCLQGNNRCDQCEQTFATVKALQLHMKVHENSEFPSQKIFLCTVCGTEFLTHKSLRLHSRMHLPVKARHVDAPEGTEEETFDCSECGTTLSESYRTAHMALHTGDSITCAVCNRKFDSEESLAMHAAVHTEAANIQHGSPNAAASAAAAVAANDLVAASGEDDTQEMEFINTGMTSATTPANTATTQDPLEVQIQKPYQCQHCGRRFTRPHEKVKHERIHTGEKPHACEVCGKKFRVSYCLTLHMRTHTGVRPYECQHCGKRFKASSVYNHHLLTHGDERAYTCPFCPKTFKTRVQLAGHKNSHTKPFRCTECSRPFASLYAARAHIQTHRKDNNLKFSCNICGASYGRAFALKDHLKQHEGETTLLSPPEPAHEEEVVQQVDSLFESEELIVPSPPRGELIHTVLDDDD